LYIPLPVICIQRSDKWAEQSADDAASEHLSLSAYHRPNEAPECGFICRAPEAVHCICRDIQTTPRYTWIHTF